MFDEPLNLIKYIPLPAEEVEFSRRQVRMIDASITFQWKGDLSDKDLSIYAACVALDRLEHEIKVRGPVKGRTCEECARIIETYAKDGVNVTFITRCIACHDRRVVADLAIHLAREAVLSSGHFD